MSAYSRNYPLISRVWHIPRLGSWHHVISTKGSCWTLNTTHKETCMLWDNVELGFTGKMSHTLHCCEWKKEKSQNTNCNTIGLLLLLRVHYCPFRRRGSLHTLPEEPRSGQKSVSRGGALWEELLGWASPCMYGGGKQAGSKWGQACSMALTESNPVLVKCSMSSILQRMAQSWRRPKISFIICM